MGNNKIKLLQSEIRTKEKVAISFNFLAFFIALIFGHHPVALIPIGALALIGISFTLMAVVSKKDLNRISRGE